MIEIQAHFSWTLFEEILQSAHCCSASKCLVPGNPHSYNFLTELKSADQSALPLIQASVFQLSTRRMKKHQLPHQLGNSAWRDQQRMRAMTQGYSWSSSSWVMMSRAIMVTNTMQWVRQQIQLFPDSSSWDVRLNQISFWGKKIFRGFVWERWKLLFWVKWKVPLLLCSSDVFDSVIRAIF